MSSPSDDTATAAAARPPRGTGAGQRSLSSRVLTRPEIGAVAAAIVIFIFFFAIAPGRSARCRSFSTVLYASPPRSGSSRSGWRC